jgi:membrane associated rhomboid family serine protease
MGFALPRPKGVVLATLIVLVAVYVFTALGARTAAGADLFSMLILEPHAVIDPGRVWTLLTYSLLHSLNDPTHLLWNGLLFYFFAPEMAARWGERRFVLFMVGAALTGGIFATVAGLLGLSGASPVVLGFSAVAVGILVAWCLTFPRREIYYFGILPLSGKKMLLITLAIEAIMGISLARVSTSAHLGGMAFAAIMTLGLWRPKTLMGWINVILVKLKLKKPRLRVVPKMSDDDRFNIH